MAVWGNEYIEHYQMFDTSLPVSPLIPLNALPDPHNVSLWCKVKSMISEDIEIICSVQVNGELRQEGNTKDMIFTLPKLISYISTYFTLSKCDIYPNSLNINDFQMRET